MSPYQIITRRRKARWQETKGGKKKEEIKD
jgi:hypothetical protein